MKRLLLRVDFGSLHDHAGFIVLGMRGRASLRTSMFSVIPIDSWTEEDHPLRVLADRISPVLERLSPEFGRIYASSGRPSIPPEQLPAGFLDIHV